MLKQILNSTMIAAIALAATATAPALAHGDRGYRDYRPYQVGNYYDGDRYYGDRDDRRYREYRGDRRYYGRSRGRGYSYNGCDKGTGGTVIGAVAGGLAGHELAGRGGDRTLGIILGAGIGAVAGRAIDRSDNRC